MSQDWVDFKSVKGAVSMEAILNRYGIQLRRVNQTYLRGKCPLPTHTSTKSGETFGVNTAKNVWACQSQSCISARGNRKGGNVLDFVALREECTIREAALKLQNWFNVPSGQSGSSPPRAEAKQTHESELVAEKREVNEATVADSHNKVLPFVLKGVAPEHPYVTSRGITKETAEHFGVGFFSGRGMMHERVVIPIHNRSGELVAYAGRAIDGSEPKYKFPAGFKKTLELWNLDRACSVNEHTVIVVEGFFDCMKVYESGHPCVVALMGSSMSDEQQNLLVENFSHAIIMLDGDQVGREAAVAIAARLSRRMFVKVIDLPDGMQPDALSTEDLRSLLGSL